MTLNLDADSAIFVNTDDFGETVTYKPSGGTNRSISAQVIRGQRGELEHPDLSRITHPEIIIHVRNDSTNGISSSELNTAQDLISVAPRKGGSAEDRTIRRIVDDHDDGILVLAV